MYGGGGGISYSNHNILPHPTVQPLINLGEVLGEVSLAHSLREPLLPPPTHRLQPWVQEAWKPLCHLASDCWDLANNGQCT